MPEARPGAGTRPSGRCPLVSALSARSKRPPDVSSLARPPRRGPASVSPPARRRRPPRYPIRASLRGRPPRAAAPRVSGQPPARGPIQGACPRRGPGPARGLRAGAPSSRRSALARNVPRTFPRSLGPRGGTPPPSRRRLVGGAHRGIRFAPRSGAGRPARSRSGLRTSHPHADRLKGRVAINTLLRTLLPRGSTARALLRTLCTRGSTARALLRTLCTRGSTRGLSAGDRDRSFIANIASPGKHGGTERPAPETARARGQIRSPSTSAPPTVRGPNRGSPRRFFRNRRLVHRLIYLKWGDAIQALGPGDSRVAGPPMGRPAGNRRRSPRPPTPTAPSPGTRCAVARDPLRRPPTRALPPNDLQGSGAAAQPPATIEPPCPSGNSKLVNRRAKG